MFIAPSPALSYGRDCLHSEYSRACRNQSALEPASQLIIELFIPQSVTVIAPAISFPLIAPSLVQNSKFSRDSRETEFGRHDSRD